VEAGPPGHAGRLGKRAWLHCDDSQHSVMIEPQEFARQHRLDMQTPLLTISKAMCCTRCGARSRTIRAGEKKMKGQPGVGIGPSPHQQTRVRARACWLLARHPHWAKAWPCVAFPQILALALPTR